MKHPSPPWHSSLSILLALGISTSGIAPLIQTQSAVAQLFPRSNRTSLAKGSTIPATYEGAERIILQPDETLAFTLVTTRSIRSSRGTVLIPIGSTIDGQLEPTRNGTQFVADTLTLRNGRRLNLDASSREITRTETIRKGSNMNAIWQGALVGGAAATIISAAVTDVGPLKSIGGAGAGALAGWLLAGRNGNRTEVLVVEPNNDLDLTLNSDLRLN